MENRRINLLLIVNSLDIGGSENHVITLVNKLDTTRFRFSLVVDTAAGNAAQCGEGTRVGIEQHLVALGRVGDHPECTTGAQLQVRYLYPPVDATDHQVFVTPVKLECFPQLKLERHEGVRRLAFTHPPAADESGQLAVPTSVAVGLNLDEQRLGGTPVLLVTVGIGFERQFQRGVKRSQFARSVVPDVCRWRSPVLGPSQPTANRIARQARALRYLMQRQLVVKMHPSNLA